MLFNDLYMETANHHQSKKLKQIRARVDKAGSSFVYFTLEANEGIAFYSTLDESSDENHRDLLIHTTPEYYAPLMAVLERLREKTPIEILSEQEVDDY